MLCASSQLLPKAPESCWLPVASGPWQFTSAETCWATSYAKSGVCVCVGGMQGMKELSATWPSVESRQEFPTAAQPQAAERLGVSCCSLQA